MQSTFNQYDYISPFIKIGKKKTSMNFSDISALINIGKKKISLN